ncbi:MAG TPA: zinc-binding dehydrogenase, partial [Spirochaetia bacterium]|nr:zinc-binding dehydrogenase [Spirochaetia bacterium]
MPARRAFALGIGADRVFDPQQTDPVAEIMKETGGRGVDAAFEAAGQPTALRQAIETAALGGRVVMVGIPAEDDWQIPSHLARRKELDLLNIRRSAFCARSLTTSYCSRA